MSEKKITSQVRKYFQELAKIRTDFFWLKLSDRFTNSIPDFYFAVNGSSAWVELKDQGKKVDKLQAWTIKKLNKCGVKAISTDDFKEVVALVESML